MAYSDFRFLTKNMAAYPIH